MSKAGGRDHGARAADPYGARQISVIAATAVDPAQRFSDRRLSEAELRELPAQEVIRRLTEVKGIGAWTVQGALLIAAAG
jgi:3-methyladenine DNA glycosylase/8-oxoguanine DNA glycosylase